MRGPRGLGVDICGQYGATEYQTKASFPEHVWCRIADRIGNNLLVGVCYRTPTDEIFGSDNHQHLRQVLDEVSNKHILLMGDFNYGGIDWEQLRTQQFCSTEGVNFFDCVQDNLLVQHVKVPDRKSAILDLVVIAEPDLID